MKIVVLMLEDELVHHRVFLKGMGVKEKFEPFVPSGSVPADPESHMRRYEVFTGEGPDRDITEVLLVNDWRVSVDLIRSRESVPGSRVDFVFVDRNGAGMDGDNAIRAIREVTGNKSVPHVYYNTTNGSEEISKSFPDYEEHIQEGPEKIKVFKEFGQKVEAFRASKKAAMARACGSERDYCALSSGVSRATVGDILKTRSERAMSLAGHEHSPSPCSLALDLTITTDAGESLSSSPKRFVDQPAVSCTDQLSFQDLDRPELFLSGSSNFSAYSTSPKLYIVSAEDFESSEEKTEKTGRTERTSVPVDAAASSCCSCFCFRPKLIQVAPSSSQTGESKSAMSSGRFL